MSKMSPMAAGRQPQYQQAPNVRTHGQGVHRGGRPKIKRGRKLGR